MTNVSNPPAKILHVIPNLGVGGAEKMLLAVCSGVGEPKFEHKVVSLKSGGGTADEMRKKNIGVQILNSADGFWEGALDLPRVYRELKKIMLEFSPRIVHTWLTRGNVIGRLAAKNAGVPIVVSSLRVMESEKKYHLWSERLTHRWSQIVTVNCTALREFAVEKIGIPWEKIVLIPNGIDLPDIETASISKSAEHFVVGTIGRLHRQKGIDVFLRSAKIVHEKFPQCRFWIAGEGPEKETLESLTRQLHLESSVKFLGLARSSEVMPRLDLFVLASRWEGMPNVILEAMALRKPVVATSVGGATDLIEQERQGLLVTPENAEALAASVIKLIENESLRRRLADAAYRKAKENFSLDRMIAAYENFYESLLSKYSVHSV